MSFAVCIYACVVAILILALVFGRRARRNVKKEQVTKMPKGFSPLNVQRIFIGKTYPRRLTAALITHWAQMGYIKVKYVSAHTVKLKKVKDLEPPDNISGGEEGEKIIENFAQEKQYFDGLFETSTEFYTLAAPSSMKNVNKQLMDSCKKTAKKRRTQKTDWFSGLSLIWAELSIIAITLINFAVYDGDGIYAAMLFPIIAIVLVKVMPNDEPIEVMIKYPFICVWGGAPLAAVLTFLPFAGAVTIGVGVAASVVTVLLSSHIDIRSDSDIEVYGKICAFKQFLLDAEKDQLETLIEDNPNYYFDILPYCYILKITKKLKSKFDTITTDGPSWYLGELRDTLMF